MINIETSVLFTEKRIGTAIIKNRFLRSATFESASNEDGSVGEEYAKIYTTLSRGGMGLIITGMISINAEGRSYRRQAGLDRDSNIDSFTAMNENIHGNGSKIFAQLGHGGRQTMIHGKHPHDASPGPRDLIFQVRPVSMDKKEILETIDSFSRAASRAKKAGFDGIQIHAAHGYLLSNFLSPLLNRRTDEWGGDPARRFMLLKRVYESVRESTGSDFPIIAKINISEHMSGGISLEEATQHIGQLSELGIDAVEISCGSVAFAPFYQSRGLVPIKEFSGKFPRLSRPFVRMVLEAAFPERKYVFEEGYNLWAAEKVRTVMGDKPLIVVGGLRSLEFMDTMVRERRADFVSLCRPFVREPLVVNRWRNGDIEKAGCTNCNKCFARVGLDKPLLCQAS
jgi:2,4-dienoyl-CoA reductase-like NADH-dependent reductase (Old Yellow Enzyme family)